MTRQYPAYRDSGVEWLGEVPTGWVVSKLSRAVDPRRHITYGIVQAGPHFEGGVPYIRPTDMADESGIAEGSTLMLTSPEVAAAYSRSEVRSGDLVCSIGPSFGKVMVVPDELSGANLTQGTARIAVAKPNNPRFVFWFLRSQVAVVQWESAIGGATFRSLNLEPLAATRMAFPPASEQTAVAAFLDRETAKIDALVAEQRRLIDLLKEKRQAVISHAVTRGLNPDAKLKPSGVDWLGDVPEGWEVKRIKNLSLLISKGTTPTTAGFDFVNVGVKFLKAENITSDGNVSYEPEFFISEEADEALKRSRLFANDVLVVIAGATTGKSAVLSADMTPSNTNQAVSFIRCREPNDAFWVQTWLSLNTVQNLIRLGSVQSAQPNLSMEDLGNLPILIAPPSERAAIAEHCARARKQVDELVNAAEAAIALLQERRAALISAAVTGKIDVRDLVPQETEAA